MFGLAVVLEGLGGPLITYYIICYGLNGYPAVLYLGVLLYYLIPLTGEGFSLICSWFKLLLIITSVFFFLCLLVGEFPVESGFPFIPFGCF